METTLSLFHMYHVKVVKDLTFLVGIQFLLFFVGRGGGLWTYKYQVQCILSVIVYIFNGTHRLTILVGLNL